MRESAVWLYQSKLIELERELEKARDKVHELENRIEPCDGREPITERAFKLKLDAIVVFIRLIKEQVMIYIRMSKSYDLTRLVQEMIDELNRIDPVLCGRILESVDRRWGDEGVDVQEVGGGE